MATQAIAEIIPPQDVLDAFGDVGNINDVHHTAWRRGISDFSSHYGTSVRATDAYVRNVLSTRR